ncbi:TetR/AcrR family transcriptional regulator [Photobacterium atrarenae]|uniref:TetR/AcrR family transcriptional regulator n=1 Tax=Photobacterium atrarenae TaxID=865757 RepID=A0ABY5GG58_9GAMM|nr:TetR/AcrR family transcriptional regulator [Photobacterium atrarenae]UTV28110.1 TetR/AcrR family transcriptional regulator [Photobacterium atrarenae]
MDTIVKKTRTRLSPEKRKQQLLDFSLEVFARRGIGRAGHADIAEMANVSVATVFNYFPTREALVEQVLNQVENRFSQVLSDCLGADSRPLYPRLTSFTDHLIEAVIEQQDWLKVWYEWSTSVRDEIWPQFVGSNKTNHERIVEMFAQAISNQEIDNSRSAEALAWQLHGICYVLYLQSNINPEQDVMREQAELHIASLLGN